MDMMETIGHILWALRKFVGLRNKELDDALILACKKRRLDDVRSLLDRGAYVNTTDTDGKTPLIIAASKRSDGLPLNDDDDSLYLAQLLMKQRGIWINERDSDGDTALIRAASNGAHRIVSALCEDSRTNVNLKNYRDNTALSCAEAHGFSRSAQILRDHGA